MCPGTRWATSDRDARMTRVAVVTGGASGIGEATARLLAKRGVAVAVFDLAGEEAVDVTDPETVRQGVDRARTYFGQPDVVPGLVRNRVAATFSQVP